MTAEFIFCGVIVCLLAMALALWASYCAVVEEAKRRDTARRASSSHTSCRIESGRIVSISLIPRADVRQPRIARRAHVTRFGKH